MEALVNPTTICALAVANMGVWLHTFTALLGG